jgi:hypothetical protein
MRERERKKPIFICYFWINSTMQISAWYFLITAMYVVLLIFF